MARRTDRNAIKKAAERKFPHRVDIQVPPEGLGIRLNRMHEWCRLNLEPGTWDQHGWLERQIGRDPVDWVRFYFSTPEAAEQFRAAWLPGGELLKVAMPQHQIPASS